MESVAVTMHESPAPDAVAEITSPPCYFWALCSQLAVIEKAGRSVCRGCAARLRGIEYPLRGPSREPIYLTGRAAAEALDMIEK